MLFHLASRLWTNQFAVSSGIRLFPGGMQTSPVFIHWADNGTAQNKNWTLFTALTLCQRTRFMLELKWVYEINEMCMILMISLKLFRNFGKQCPWNTPNSTSIRMNLVPLHSPTSPTGEYCSRDDVQAWVQQHVLEWILGRRYLPGW